MRILTLPCLTIAAALTFGLAGHAEAGGRFAHGHGGHGFHNHGGQGYGGQGFGLRHRGFRGTFAAPYGFGYGFSNVAVNGDYLGAPWTRFPRPSEIVPPAWGHGTYGIPTVTGIRAAPVAEPTLYVINGVSPARTTWNGQARSRVLSRGGDGAWTNPPEQGVSENVAGARVITVTVPRR